MRYDEHYSNLFDAAHDILEDVDGKIGYCNSDGHLHDPYNLVLHKKLLKKDDYYCKRCEQRFSKQTVSKAKMLWNIVRHHFEGFEPLIWDRDYKIHLSRGNRDPRIEIVAKKKAEYVDEALPPRFVIEDSEDLDELPNAIQEPIDEEADNQ